MVVFKCLQANINKGRELTVELFELANSSKAEIVGIQEPYTYLDTRADHHKPAGISRRFNTVYHRSTNRPKALLAVDRKFKLNQIERYTNEFMATGVIGLAGGQLVVVSLYLNLKDSGRDRNIQIDLDLLQRLFIEFDKENSQIIILTDSNCRSSRWGDDESKKFDQTRSNHLLDFFAANSVVVHNRPECGPTYIKEIIRDGRAEFWTSYIDLTLSNRALETSVNRWTLVDYVDTEHRQIMFELETSTSKNSEHTCTYKMYDTKKTDWRLFDETFEQNRPKLDNVTKPEQLEKVAENLIDAVQKSLRKSSPVIKRREDDQPWYCEKLRDRQKQIEKLRKKKAKANNPTVRLLLRDQINELNRIKRKERAEAKKAYFEKLNEVHSLNDMWRLLKKAKTVRGDSFKEYKNSEGEPITNPSEIDQDLFDSYVPKYENRDLENYEIVDDGELEETSAEELKEIMKNTAMNKAPGYDRISNAVLRHLINCHAETMTSFFNLCLNLVYFPICLKIGKLVFFQKPGKRMENAKCLRPITLLSVIGKLLEKLLIDRINWELEQRSFFDESQHGFRRSKSTVTAANELIGQMRMARKKNFAVVLALDISSAFDRVGWMHMLKNVEKAGVRRCYLQAIRQLLIRRRVEYDAEDRTFRRESRVGAPQGGRASPSLWVYAMNDLLANLNLIDNVKAIAYADDLTLIIREHRHYKLDQKIRQCLNVVEQWCQSAGLKVSAGKTQWIDVGKRPAIADVAIDGIEIERSESIKFLGLMISKDGKWRQHLEYLKAKTDKFVRVYGAIRFMNNSLTLERRRTLYRQVFLPMIMYGQRVWARELKFKYQLHELAKLQRRALLALTGCYRTTSYEKLFSVLGVLSIAREIKYFEESRSMDREQRMELYGSMMGEQGYDGTYQTLKSSRRKETLWCVTQHGPFRAHLRRIGVDEDDQCRFCAGEAETVEHLVNVCPKFRELKIEESTIEDDLHGLEEKLRTLTREIWKTSAHEQ